MNAASRAAKLTPERAQVTLPGRPGSSVPAAAACCSQPRDVQCASRAMRPSGGCPQRGGEPGSARSGHGPLRVAGERGALGAVGVRVAPHGSPGASRGKCRSLGVIQEESDGLVVGTRAKGSGGVPGRPEPSSGALGGDSAVGGVVCRTTGRHADVSGASSLHTQVSRVMNNVPREAGCHVRRANGRAGARSAARCGGRSEGAGAGGALRSPRGRRCVFWALRTGGSADTAWGWAGAGRPRSAPCGSCTRTAGGQKHRA